MSESESVADGLDHQLDPRIISVERIVGGVLIAAIAAGGLVALTIVFIAADDIPSWLRIFLPVVWLTFVTLGSAFAYQRPARQYAHASYRVDDQGIEIRKGVFWRVVINVPKSRVQHIDVSQGPLDRRYGLGKLVIYTAGTDHAKVELDGLEHGLALRVREHLLPSGAGDAV